MRFMENSKWKTEEYEPLFNFIMTECIGKTLDVGCGRGEITLALDRAVGIDVKFFSEWEKGLKKFEVFNGKTFSGKGFDTVLFNNSFEHVVDKWLLVSSLKESNPKAKVVVVVPTVWYLMRRYCEGILRLITLNSPRVYFIHAENVYGLNFIKEFWYYLNWKERLSCYFVLNKPKRFRNHLIFVGRFK